MWFVNTSSCFPFSLCIISPNFSSFPLKTKKFASFSLFSQASLFSSLTQPRSRNRVFVGVWRCLKYTLLLRTAHIWYRPGPLGNEKTIFYLMMRPKCSYGPILRRKFFFFFFFFLIIYLFVSFKHEEKLIKMKIFWVT